eukprot:Sspe_Gene.94657::Locus_67005_Transcript_1_1_Confidence_1.000_Length_652::g.94657::m.94657
MSGDEEGDLLLAVVPEGEAVRGMPGGLDVERFDGVEGQLGPQSDGAMLEAAQPAARRGGDDGVSDGEGRAIRRLFGTDEEKVEEEEMYWLGWAAEGSVFGAVQWGISSGAVREEEEEEEE